MNRGEDDGIETTVSMMILIIRQKRAILEADNVTELRIRIQPDLVLKKKTEIRTRIFRTI